VAAPLHSTRARRAALAAAAAALGALGALAAPAGATFSYLREPTDQLGLPGYVAGAAVLPNHDVYTGWTEFGIRVGDTRRTLSPAGRDLEQGWMPIIRTQQVEGRVLYVYQTLMSVVGGQQVIFGRVSAVNLSQKARSSAEVTAGVRFNGGDLVNRGTRRVRKFRFPRDVAPTRPGLYLQPGVDFNAASVYAFSGRALTRDGLALYIAPPPPAGAVVKQTERPGTGPVVPKTTFGETNYEFDLAPGQTINLDYKLPLVPVPAGSPAQAAVDAASFNDARERLIASWTDQLAPAMQVEVPERKVQDAYYASLATILQNRYRLANGQWVQTVNKLRYHAFWLRDASIMTQALDLVGLNRLARQNLDFFPTWQEPSGQFISRTEQWDGHGQTLWAYAEHVRRTGDLGFARSVFPSVKRAMAWLAAARAADPLKLLPPVTTPYDNELVPGHLPGDNFWGLAGAKGAIDIATRLGDKATAAAWTREYNQYRATVVRQIRAAAATTGGWVPPSLDRKGGQDWGNAWLVYPEPVLALDDPLVTATLRHLRSRRREGISTFFYTGQRWIHAYLGFRVIQTELARGEQQRVVDGLYGELAHTTSTHQGWELALPSTRTVVDATAPHGWFSAEYVALLRNLLVREAGPATVQLMSATPTAWLRPGQTIAVRNARTTRGPLAFRIETTDGGATLTWSSKLAAGTRLVFTVPAGARSTSAPGLSADRKTVVLRGARGSIKLRWRLAPPIPTFDSTALALRTEIEQGSARTASSAADQAAGVSG
jgi:hypothetical protein